MKHRVEFDPERQVAIIRYRGELRAEDPAELIRELVGKPGWTPRCARIVLYDEALMGEMTAGDFKKTAALLQPLIARHYGSAPSFSAHVCVDPLQRASLEYWMALGEAIYSPSMALFDTLAEAEAWIAAQRALLDR